MSPEVANLQRSFALDSDILAPGSAVNLDLSGSTAADVALAIVKDDVETRWSVPESLFPGRKGGDPS